MMRTLCFLLFLGPSSACVLPPVRVSAGGGGAAGDVVIRNSDSALRHYGRTANGQVRFGLTPMTLGKNIDRRRGDLSLGWSFDWESAGHQRHDFRHGPYIEGVWFTKRSSAVDRQGWRAGPTALLELPMGLADTGLEGRGYGAAVGGIYELAGDASGPVFGGGSLGELGLGFSARIGARHIDGGTHINGVFSVEVRTPGIASWIVVPQPRSR